MRTISAIFLVNVLFFGFVPGQTPQKPQPQTTPEEVVRISTELVQADVVVMDKNDQIVTDLKLEDFEVYENGKRQDIKFMEFVSVESGRRSEGELADAAVDAENSRNLSGAELKRVIAFVVDDLTIPVEDMFVTRKLLTDFVDNKMGAGDLVAIVRSVGGKGLLQQFTSDRQLLRRAIAALTPRSSPFSAFNSPTNRVNQLPSPTGGTSDPNAFAESLSGVEAGLDAEGLGSGLDIGDPADDTNRTFRALMSLSTANFVIESLRQIPGRKSLVLISGGLPLFEIGRGGALVGNVSDLFNRLADNATRAGVVINTMDIRGLKVTGAVARFVDTPGKSALGGGTVAGTDYDPAFGRMANTTLLGDKPFGQLEGQLGLRTLANATGGIAVVNTSNFGQGLDKVLTRSSGYYRLAYRPTEKFDGKFHKLQIKVKRDGVRSYAPDGFIATARREGEGAMRTKEEQIMAAARSPLARRDLDMSANFLLKFTPDGNAALDIHIFVAPNTLQFKQANDGNYETSFDVVGFVFDQLGRSRGGFSETVNATLSPENYQRARNTGISYTASTQLPPGYFQVRAVVREAATGNLGSLSRYFEIPDLRDKRLTMSSIFLYGVTPVSLTGQKPTFDPLLASHIISRKQDLRYATIIYNAKLDKNTPQLRSRLMISQGNRILFQEPDLSVEPQVGATTTSPIMKIGQLGLSKVPSGRYLLTLVITDALADKKSQRVSRSVDFTVVD